MEATVFGGSNLARGSKTGVRTLPCGGVMLIGLTGI